MLRVLIFLVSLGARALRAMCRRRADLVIENLALRQQVTALKRRAPPPTARRRRSSFLGRTPKLVARVGESPAHRQRGYSSPVASGSVQAILGEDFPTPASGTTSRRRRDSWTHPADGARRLGCSSYPRRAHEARASSSQRRPCRDTCRGCQLRPIK